MPTGDNVGYLVRSNACGAHAKVDCVVGEPPGVFVPIQAFLFYGGLQLAVHDDGSRTVVKEIYAQNRPQWDNLRTRINKALAMGRLASKVITA
jgi:hypothetical protein